MSSASLPQALTAFWQGAFGSTDAIISATLVRATPLILAGLAVPVAFRASMLNLGAEGQLLVGAAAAATVGVVLVPGLGGATVIAALVAGAVAGACWAGIAAWLRERFGVLEVISTIMLNFVALYAVGWLVRGPLQEPTHVYPQSATLVPDSRLHAGLALAVGAAVALWWTLRATAAGFRLRAVGRDAGVPATVAGVVEAALVLVVLAMDPRVASAAPYHQCPTSSAVSSARYPSCPLHHPSPTAHRVPPTPLRGIVMLPFTGHALGVRSSTTPTSPAHARRPPRR